MALTFEERAQGVICGGAVGDAIGAPVETHSPEEIRKRYGGWVEGIVEPFHPDPRRAKPMAPYHKGDGHITDDTLMVLALVEVYARKRDHLDAFDMFDLLVPELTEKVTYIPELGEEMPIARRLAPTERFMLVRLDKGHVDPREAGAGNAVNCGAAMYMAPVGIVNAGDPEGAYREAIEISGAHQSSFGREAAGVFAAAVAAALRPGASVSGVIDACLTLARDGTKRAIEAVVEEAQRHSDWREAIEPLRRAVAPYDTVGETYTKPGLGAYRPSRLHAIEELPIALGMLVVAKGNYREAVLGGTNYGRDADSIASMAGAIAGGLGGVSAIPDNWLEAVVKASRKDLVGAGSVIARVAREVSEKDRRKAEALFAVRDELFGQSLEKAV